MKKLLSMALALAMTLGLAVSSHAADTRDLKVELLHPDGSIMADSEYRTEAVPMVQQDDWVGSMNLNESFPINIVPHNARIWLKNTSTDPSCYFIVVRENGSYLDRAGMLEKLGVSEAEFQKGLADPGSCILGENDPVVMNRLDQLLTGDRTIHFYEKQVGPTNDPMSEGVSDGRLLAILAPGQEKTLPLPMYDLSKGSHGGLAVYGVCINLDMISPQYMNPEFLGSEYLPTTDRFDTYYMFQSDSETPRLRFADVAAGEWYFNPIKWAATNGVVAGVGDYAFAPKATCTKSQILQMLYNAYGVNGFYGELYPGLTGSEWYADAVSFAYEKGALEAGVDVNSPCTRAEAMYYQYVMEHELVAQPDTSGIHFSDVAPGSRYETAIKWGAANGITAGYTDGRFGVSDTCTRAQIVTFLYNGRAILSQLKG